MSSSIAREAGGLVLPPTSRTRGPELPLSTAGEVAGVMDAVGAFVAGGPHAKLGKLRCAVGVAARCHQAQGRAGRPLRAWMLTLTYRGDADGWRPEHMPRAMQHLRMWCNRQELVARYTWVAELQQRGVIHYHAVVWLPRGIRLPAFDSKGWWPHGMTNRKCVRSCAVGYLMKYLSKGCDLAACRLPKGARSYGVGGLDLAMRRARRWLRLPAFVKGNSSTLDTWDRAPGGGWTAPDGTRFVSEFRATSIAGIRCLVRVVEHPRAIEAAGAFSWLTDRAKAQALPGHRFN